MKIFTILPEKTSSLPKEPGVYILYGKRKIPLYIGKASNLKERVKNHFPPRSRTWTVPLKAERDKQSSVQVSLRGKQPGFKDNLFINKIKKIGYIPLESDIEALILESKLIKKHQPKFNVLFRDDKKYFYVGGTEEDWPRIFITHQPILKSYKAKKLKNYTLNAEYIGPFTDGAALKQTLKILRKVFPYRTCKFLPKKPCLWHHLSRCPAPCLIKKELKVRKVLKKETAKRKQDYKKDIKKLKLVLKGERKRLITTLTKEMKKMAKIEEFERAARIRDQIDSLRRVFAHKKILTEIPQKEKRKVNIGLLLKKALGLPKIPKRIEGYDISNIKNKEMVGSMIVFSLISTNLRTNFHEYGPDKNEYRRFKIKTVKKQNDIACLKEIIKRRLSHREWSFPDLIFVDGGKAQFNAAKEVIDGYWKEKLKPRFFAPYRKTGSKATARNRGCLEPGVGAKKPSIISLAKKKNLLYNVFFKRPLSLDKLPQEVKMTILYLRDESHRFSIFYHKKLREKTFLPHKQNIQNQKKKLRGSNL